MLPRGRGAADAVRSTKTARVHHAARWGSHILAAGGAGAAGDAGDRSARRPERSRMEAAVGDVPEIVARPRLRRWTEFRIRVSLGGRAERSVASTCGRTRATPSIGDLCD